MRKRVVLVVAALAGCTSTGGDGGAGGSPPVETVVPAERCCPDPGMLGYSTDFRCYHEGLVCPWIWMDTGAVGGGVVRCGAVRWGDIEDCPDGDVAADCPGEGADLGACDGASPGDCVCVCRSGRGVCEQSAECADGRWIALPSSLGDTAWCRPCSPVTVTAWLDGSCTAERTCVRDDHLVDCTPTEDGSSCDCSVAGAVLGTCVEDRRGEAACSLEDGCCAEVFASR